MLKPLTKEQTDGILRVAAGEFAYKGFAGTTLSSISKKAGVSVGVIYKYYSDKEDLFNACVGKSLESLKDVLNSTETEGRTLTEIAGSLITETQKFAKENPEYIRLYHQITVSGSPSGREGSAELIEGVAAKTYKEAIQKAVASGDVRGDIDPGAFAFFFDNLMMMLHFAYACDYYKDRFMIYCGDDADEKDEFIREQMLKFIGGALNG